MIRCLEKCCCKQKETNAFLVEIQNVARQQRKELRWTNEHETEVPPQIALLRSVHTIDLSDNSLDILSFPEKSWVDT